MSALGDGLLGFVGGAVAGADSYIAEERKAAAAMAEQDRIDSREEKMLKLRQEWEKEKIGLQSAVDHAYRTSENVAKTEAERETARLEREAEEESKRRGLLFELDAAAEFYNKTGMTAPGFQAPRAADEDSGDLSDREKLENERAVDEAISLLEASLPDPSTAVDQDSQMTLAALSAGLASSKGATSQDSRETLRALQTRLYKLYKEDKNRKALEVYLILQQRPTSGDPQEVNEWSALFREAIESMSTAGPADDALSGKDRAGLGSGKYNK